MPKKKELNDRRREYRFETHSDVTVQNLTRRSAAQVGVLREVSQGGMLIETSDQLSLDAALEVLVGGTIFFGEVVHERHEPSGTWVTGIRLIMRMSEEDIWNITERWRSSLAPLK